MKISRVWQTSSESGSVTISSVALVSTTHGLSSSIGTLVLSVTVYFRPCGTTLLLWLNVCVQMTVLPSRNIIVYVGYL